ncbi:MAG: PilT/PilU family type 4a pilus ATPase, partial [Myxococcota bacterium]|nr:PilT/PilU family type 4a pilus ATPase [Myxococcota bacterium]
RQQGALSVVARAVPSGALQLEDLHLPEVVRDLADRPRGLVLVTGATGSGKSTTLAAMVHHINERRPAHIVTVEDPIEFVHQDLAARVTQREVGTDTASFHEALRRVVRQSPDVIVISELRDAETMSVAVTAALTGHLVLASLHTIDATQTLQRILSQFPEHMRGQVAMDLSMSLQGVISQRLLPAASGEGRVLAAEILTVTAAVARLLREQRVADLHDLMRSLRSPGMRTFHDSLLHLLQRGLITHATGMAYATNPDEFALATKGMSTGTDMFQGDGSTDVSEGLDMQRLLGQAMERGASDLHLTSGRPPILRVSGGLEAIGTAALNDADMRMLLHSIMSARQRSIYELEREIDFALAVDGGKRFRVNAYFQKGRMAAALRAIPSVVPDASALRLPGAVLDLGLKPQGLMLVVGPTGAGKSTTLACMLDRINRTRACRIITIEDPVEYAHDSQRATVDQREVFADTKSFSAALKYILRQDPDVILVGEMRDLETISSAITAAETGHLVLATLHANDASQAIDRIIDVFPSHQQGQARSQLSQCLLGVVSQRLLPRRDGAGRIAAFEVMVGTSAIRTLIRDNKMHMAHGIMESARRDGMVTMDQALKRLYDEALISFESAQRYLSNPRAIAAPPSGGGGAPPYTGPMRSSPAAGAASPPPPTKGRFPWSKG